MQTYTYSLYAPLDQVVAAPGLHDLSSCIAVFRQVNISFGHLLNCSYMTGRQFLAPFIEHGVLLLGSETPAVT